MKLSVAHQLEVFRNPPQRLVLDRPCTIGDGIRRVSRADLSRYVLVADQARLEGRFTKFVPASGASTRMFKDVAAGEVRAFIKGLKRFPFYGALERTLARDELKIHSLLRRGDFGTIVDNLLTPRGLNFGALPKALVPFHRYPEGARTALEEHLAEAPGLLKDRRGLCRLHFTVSPEHRGLFESFVVEKAPFYERLCRCRYRIGFSVQKESTKTIAVDQKGRLVRLKDGRLLFRPAGHGALIENLNDLKADILFISNIDNVPVDRKRDEVVRWRKVLAGLLIGFQEEVFSHMARLLKNPRGHRELIDKLNSPLRVCGVVKNEGEPGGGPFWVRDSSGEQSPQIVESAEVSQDRTQQKIFSSSTHFNPVDIVCGLRDWRGKPFDLKKFVDPSAVFISRRFHEGREIKVLELPGLWNGGMYRWNTVFVEIPNSNFNPVKTLTDLLKPNHQA
jgi:hypothetical protein